MSNLTNIDTELIMNSIRNNYLLFLIFLLGLVLRIYDLCSESMWLDEGYSVAVAKLDLVALIKQNFLSDYNHPPLYNAILHYWVLIFGDSEFASRLPSAIFGSFSIIAIYMVGRLAFNKNVGLLAALILATSIFHIKYSQEARSYSLLVFLTLLSYYFYLKIVSSKKRLYFLGYILSSVLLLYTHYFGFLIVAAQNIFFFTEYLGSRKVGELGLKKWLESQVVLFLLYIPGFVKLVITIIHTEGGGWRPETSLLDILKYFGSYSGSVSLFILFLIFSSLSILGLRQFKDKIGLKAILKPIEEYSEKLPLSNSNCVYLLVLWLFIPIALPYLVSLFTFPILILRYTIMGSPALYLLVAKGIDNFVNRKVMVLVGALILVFSYFNIEEYQKSIKKTQWRETIAYIENNAGYGDSVVVYPYHLKYVANYYLERKDLHLNSLTDPFLLGTDISSKNLWAVTRIKNEMVEQAKNEMLEQALGENYDLLSQKIFKSWKVDLKLYKYRKKDSR